MKRHHVAPEHAIELATGFEYPVEATDDLECPVGDQEQVAEVLRRVALFTLPPAGDGHATRRLRAGYIRWVALIYLTNRDLVEHQRPQEVAAALGITRQGFEKHLKALRDRGVGYGGPAH